MNVCLRCTQPTPNPKFCSLSCAATYNNTQRKPRTVESKIKTSVTLKAHKKHIGLKPYTPVSCCKWCGKWFVGKRKTCSKQCFVNVLSVSQTKLLKERHRSTTKRVNYTGQSWMEKAFEGWLRNNLFTEYETEVKIYNHEQNKHYYVDFMFQKHELIVELDGTQHNKTKELDAIRDEFIHRTTGMRILRITAKEFKQQTHTHTIKQLLGI